MDAGRGSPGFLRRRLIVCDGPADAGHRAAVDASDRIRRAITKSGAATIIVATGTSQMVLLEHLSMSPEIDWSRVTVFHLDEYAGLPADHSASFRRFLRERFIEELPEPPLDFFELNGEGDLEAERQRVGSIISEYEIDLALVGIGENAHLAFNDPPADFETRQRFLVVQLDEACRRQQVGEGWFKKLDDVPRRAITMSIRQILASEAIICTVPDRRKAKALRDAIDGPMTRDVPASALRVHGNVTIYADHDSVSLLEPGVR
jgi:glucosamine-6-phosphate deaminase